MSLGSNFFRNNNYNNFANINNQPHNDYFSSIGYSIQPRINQLHSQLQKYGYGNPNLFSNPNTNINNNNSITKLQLDNEDLRKQLDRLKDFKHKTDVESQMIAQNLRSNYFTKPVNIKVSQKPPEKYNYLKKRIYNQYNYLDKPVESEISSITQSEVDDEDENEDDDDDEHEGRDTRRSRKKLRKRNSILSSSMPILPPINTQMHQEMVFKLQIDNMKTRNNLSQIKGTMKDFKTNVFEKLSEVERSQKQVLNQLQQVMQVSNDKSLIRASDKTFNKTRSKLSHKEPKFTLSQVENNPSLQKIVVDLMQKNLENNNMRNRIVQQMDNPHAYPSPHIHPHIHPQPYPQPYPHSRTRPGPHDNECNHSCCFSPQQNSMMQQSPQRNKKTRNKSGSDKKAKTKNSKVDTKTLKQKKTKKKNQKPIEDEENQDEDQEQYQEQGEDNDEEERKPSPKKTKAKKKAVNRPQQMIQLNNTQV